MTDNTNDLDDLFPEVESMYTEEPISTAMVEEQTEDDLDDLIDFSDKNVESICESNWGTVGGIDYSSPLTTNDLNNELLHKIFNLDPDTNQLFSKFSTQHSSCVKNIIYNGNGKNLSNDIFSIEVITLYYMIHVSPHSIVEGRSKLNLFHERCLDFTNHVGTIVENYDNWAQYNFVMPYYQYDGKKLYKGYPVADGYSNDKPDDWPYTAPITLIYTKKPDVNGNARVVILVGVNNSENCTSVINGINSIMYQNFIESLEFGWVTEVNDVTVPDKSQPDESQPDKPHGKKHMVINKNLLKKIEIVNRIGNVLDYLNSPVITTLHKVLSNAIQAQDLELKSSLSIQKYISPNLMESNEICYYKSNKSKKLNRFTGKISPYFIHSDDAYKNFYNHKLEQSDLPITQKVFYEYQNKGFQPLYPSLGYYLIGSDDKIKYKLEDPTSKMEHHTYLDNRIIKLAPEMDLKFSTTDAIKDNIRDYVYSVFKTKYKNILGEEPKDKNSDEYKVYESGLKYITELYKVDHTSIDSEIEDNKYHTTYNIKISLK